MKALKLVTTAAVFIVSAFINVDAGYSAAHADTTVVTKTMSSETFNRFEEGLLFGLSSDVIGVIESSMFNAIHYKIAYPEFTSVKVEEQLKTIAIEGSNHSLRYKAYLALNYYRNPGDFASPEVLLSLLDSSFQNGIFFYLQETVQSDQFTSKYK